MSHGFGDCEDLEICVTVKPAYPPARLFLKENLVGMMENGQAALLE
jgi:hypothetical protein